MKDEALKLALEALELNNSEWKSLAESGDCGYWHAEDQDHYKQTNEAITAIKQALAAPVQKRPQNCGTGYCSCIECVMEPAPVQKGAIGAAYQKSPWDEKGISMPPPEAPVQEPKFWYDQEEGLLHDHFGDSPLGCIPLYTTAPAAQPAVPDAFGTREGEHPQYIQGWNDCRQAMMEMKK